MNAPIDKALTSSLKAKMAAIFFYVVVFVGKHAQVTSYGYNAGKTPINTYS